MRAAGLCLVILPLVAAHGQLVHPRSRNSIDYLVNVSDPDGHKCTNLTDPSAPCLNGQASFWYSQGCFIGCAECDHVSGRRQTDLCKSGMQPTNNGAARSLNLEATPNSPEDIYRHNPWRSPGAAPVGDPCGFAGGTPWGANVAEEGIYTNTSFAHHGMRGTALPPLPTGVVWKLGGEVEVAWNVRNNHGGGYSFRLCPASEPLTEACFQRTPLDFVTSKQAILLGNGTRVPIAGRFLSEGTTPKGSMWARSPIPATALGPRCLPGPNDTSATPHGCEEWEGREEPSGHWGHVDGPCVPCPETPGSDCSRCSNPGWPGVGPRPAFPPHVDGVYEAPAAIIVDVLKVPAGLQPGKWVLGWRWDCEGTAQVWQNCADVQLA